MGKGMVGEAKEGIQGRRRRLTGPGRWKYS